jgi:ribosomal-protein-alanine N-acetyltransferase
MDKQTDSLAHIHIETATLWDLNAIRELERVCFPQDAWPLLEMVGVLSLPSVLRWKVLDGEQLVAFVAADVRRSQNVAWIATISVHPDYRRQGLGSRLMTLAEESVGTKAMRLSARASNREALQLYQERGYEQIDVWPKYYVGGEDAVVMEKMLPSRQ